jgi:hypothetical protein
MLHGQAAGAYACSDNRLPAHWHIQKVAELRGVNGASSAYLTPKGAHNFELTLYSPIKYSGHTDVYSLSETGAISNHVAFDGIPSGLGNQQPAPDGGSWNVAINLDKTGQNYTIASAVFQDVNGGRSGVPITVSEPVSRAWAPGCHSSVWIAEGDWQKANVIEHVAASGKVISSTTLPNTTNVETEGDGYGNGLIGGLALVSGGQVCYSRQFDSRLPGYKTFFGCISAGGGVTEKPCPLGDEPRGPYVTGPDGAMWTIGSSDRPGLVRVDPDARAQLIDLTPYLSGSIIDEGSLASLDGALWFVSGVETSLYKVSFS